MGEGGCCLLGKSDVLSEFGKFFGLGGETHDIHFLLSSSKFHKKLHKTAWIKPPHQLGKIAIEDIAIKLTPGT